MTCSSEPEEHGILSNRFHPGGETNAVALRSREGGACDFLECATSVQSCVRA